MSAVEKELSVALGIFARTARTRSLYSPNNRVRSKMMAELTRAFGRLFEETPDVTLSVRPSAFVYEDIAVFEESADPSVPLLFFRDGVRRLELSRGLSEAELEILLDATAHGLSRRGLDDDIVSILWCHHLEHLRYVTVDPNIADASPAELEPKAGLDAQIDALIRSIYRTAGEDSVLRSVHIDTSDLDARRIADALGSADETAPGFFPPKHFVARPVYAERLVGEVAEESDESVMELAASAAVEALGLATDRHDADALAAALIAIYDAALLEERLLLAGRIFKWIDALPESHPNRRDLLAAAISEERIRQLVAIGQNDAARELEVMDFLKSCGRTIVPALIALLPSLSEPRQRRAYSDLALGMGTEDVAPIQELLDSEQGFVAAEALRMLAEMGKVDRRTARAAAMHPKPQVRLMALQIAERVDRELGQELVLDLLEDQEARVRIEAVQILDRFDGARARSAIEAALARDEFEDGSAPLKEAFLRAYVTVAGRHAFGRLEEMILATDRRLARRQVEETGVAAVAAIASLPNTRSVDILKKACLSRNKRVRELARAELKLLRKDFE